MFDVTSSLAQLPPEAPLDMRLDPIHNHNVRYTIPVKQQRECLVCILLFHHGKSSFPSVCSTKHLVCLATLS
jgi:hypothetical protein